METSASSPADRAAPRWDEPEAERDRYAFYGVAIRSEAVLFVLDVSGSMSGTPLDNLKSELATAIGRMPPTTRFNMIAFESNVDPWSTRLVHAKPATKKAALWFVKKLQAGGSTGLWNALKAALKDKHVDTLVILSDGAPNTDINIIRRWFLQQNRERMILLHAIALGHQSRSLKAMALLSGGTYRER